MNIVVMGKRGHGKSTLARYLAERIQARTNGHPLLIFDPKRTYRAIPHTSDLDEFDELATGGEASEVAFHPLGNVEEDFDAFIETVGVEELLGAGENASRKNLGSVVVLVDEAWMLKTNENLARLVRLADSKRFYLIQAAHRPSDFSTATRAQVDELFLFSQWLSDDLDIIREWAGSDVEARVASLPRYHVVRYEIGSQKFEVWENPEAWFLENSDNGGKSSRDAEAPEAPVETVA